jgi:hypothetical protein
VFEGGNLFEAPVSSAQQKPTGQPMVDTPGLDRTMATHFERSAKLRLTLLWLIRCLTGAGNGEWAGSPGYALS